VILHPVQPPNGESPTRALLGSNNIEWAVVEESFRSTYVHKDGLGSKKEAELWLAALEVTIGRERHEHFMRTDGHIMSKPMEIAWRKVDYWHREDPPLS
jgi:hypothetical protein